MNITGYDLHATGGCPGRDELGVVVGDIFFCQKECNENPDCVSFEMRKNTGVNCTLSSSCTYGLTVQDENDDQCFYQKRN